MTATLPRAQHLARTGISKAAAIAPAAAAAHWVASEMPTHGVQNRMLRKATKLTWTFAFEARWREIVYPLVDASPG